MCIPSPTHFVGVVRDWRSVVDRKLYPELDPLFHDLALAYRKAIRAFADAGCSYLQIDDCNFAFLCDPAVRRALAQRGDDPQAMLRAFAKLVADSLAERPPGMTITMHSCRGNFRSTWLSEGSWEAVAEVMFNTVPVDGFFLEYDSERAGGFEPLRFMPKHRNVVLGLISSKLRRAGAEGCDQAPDRRSHPLRRSRPAAPEPAMRLRQHPGRQPDERGRAVAQARPRGGDRRRGVAQLISRGTHAKVNGSKIPRFLTLGSVPVMQCRVARSQPPR